MKKRSRAGQRRHLVAFQKKGTGTDGAGGVETGWSEQFRCRAQFIHLRGGEAVLAGRLEGRHMQIIRLRTFADSRLVTADWRVIDLRTNNKFNVRDITPSDNRHYLDFLCESGVAV